MKCEQIGVEVSRNEVVEFLNSIQPGQFFHIRGYTDALGEKADYWLRFGIKYNNLKKRDIQFLEDIRDGKIVSKNLNLCHGVWVDPVLIPSLFLSFQDLASLSIQEKNMLVNVKVNYEITVNDVTAQVEQSGFINFMNIDFLSNRNGKGRIPVVLSYCLPYNHPLIMTVIGSEDVKGSLLQGLTSPHNTTGEYNREGQSTYSLEKDSINRWYIRDVLIVKKVIRVPINHPFTATLPINGIKKAIQNQWLLTGSYRQFILNDGQFESVTIEGQSILVDGIDETFYFALPEVVKEAVHNDVLS